MPLAKAICEVPNACRSHEIEVDHNMICNHASLIQTASRTLEMKMVVYSNQGDCYELVELTEPLVDEAPLRRRAESVAVVSWRLVCSCMILVDVSD
jgi:hypothetical protein